MDRSKKSKPRAFLLLNVFLIVSTVIVFTVLALLSYLTDKNKEERELSELLNQGCNIVEKELLNTIGNVDKAKNIISVWCSGINKPINFYFFDDENYQESNVKELYISDASYIENDKSLIKSIQNGEKDIEDGKINQNEKGSIVPYCVQKVEISENEVYIVLVIPHFQAKSVANEWASVFLLPVLLSVILSVLLSLLFTNLSLKPVRIMSEVISSVAEGDYSVRVDERYCALNENYRGTLSTDFSDMGRTLNYMVEVLANQEHDRNIFISSIAHDIRTPLTSINGFITAMVDGVIPADMYDHYFELIRHEVGRISTLVNSMTEAASLSHVNKELMEKFCLNEMIEDIVGGLEPQIKSKEITVLTDIKSENKVFAYAEPQLICRVLYNIISNAIKFTPVQGRIRITLEPDYQSRRVYISIEDSGPGIPTDKRERVFDSFYKVDASRKVEGFGLGLYICKQILLGYGEGITVSRSEELGGASFNFSIGMPNDNANEK